MLVLNKPVKWWINDCKYMKIISVNLFIFHYCLASVRYWEDGHHIHFFICSSHIWFSYLFTVICSWSLYFLWTLAVFSFPIDAGDDVEHLVIILKKLCIQAFTCQLYHICSTCLFTCWTCLWCRDSAQCLTTQTSHIYLTPLEYYTTQSHGSKHLL